MVEEQTLPVVTAYSATLFKQFRLSDKVVMRGRVKQFNRPYMILEDDEVGYCSFDVYKIIIDDGLGVFMAMSLIGFDAERNLGSVLRPGMEVIVVGYLQDPNNLSLTKKSPMPLILCQQVIPILPDMEMG